MGSLHWPVFLTAPNAEIKTLNRAFLLLQDFEFTDINEESSWVLVTSSHLPLPLPLKPAFPPLEEPSINDFINATFADINTFIRANESRFQASDLSARNWVIIDQHGLDTSTCLVVEQMSTREAESTNDFRAARVPYTEAWCMFANLDIANMGFEEHVDMDSGVQPDGSYRLAEELSPERGSVWDAKREAALKAMRDLGHIE